MKYNSAILFLLIATGVSQLSAQQNVVVVDMGRIFREHTAFKNAINSLQKEVEAFKGTIQQDRTTIQTESETLVAMDKSTPAFKAKEESLAKLAAEMQVNHKIKNREFMEREAKVYYQTYVQVLNTIQSFCRQNNVTLVIRFTSDPIDASNRTSVLAGVNNIVVYQDRRDITATIIETINGVPSTANRNVNPNR